MPRFSRRPFRRRFRKRRAVAWQTQAQLHGQGTLEVGSAESPVPEYWAIQALDNDFVANHPRFAKANDTVSLRRILGMLRIGYYRDDGSANGTDYKVHYGICVVPGDYDSAGTWQRSVPAPQPSEESDEDDKWLFKNTIFLTSQQWSSNLRLDSYDNYLLAKGSAQVSTDIPVVRWPIRDGLMSTDHQLPNGSHIDIKTRRRLQYGERLFIVTEVEGLADEHAVFYLNWDLRMLCAKWS